MSVVTPSPADHPARPLLTMAAAATLALALVVALVLALAAGTPWQSSDSPLAGREAAYLRHVDATAFLPAVGVDDDVLLSEGRHACAATSAGAQTPRLSTARLISLGVAPGAAQAVLHTAQTHLCP